MLPLVTVEDVVGLGAWIAGVVAVLGAGYLVGWFGFQRARPGLVVVVGGVAATVLVAVVGYVVVSQAAKGDDDWAGFLEFLLFLLLAAFTVAITWFGVGMAAGGALRRRRDAQRGFSPPRSRSQT